MVHKLFSGLKELISYIGLPLTVIPYKVTQIEFVSPNDILITAICNKMGICGNFLLVIGVTKGGRGGRCSKSKRFNSNSVFVKFLK